MLVMADMMMMMLMILMADMDDDVDIVFKESKADMDDGGRHG